MKIINTNKRKNINNFFAPLSKKEHFDIQNNIWGPYCKPVEINKKIRCSYPLPSLNPAASIDLENLTYKVSKDCENLAHLEKLGFKKE